MSNVLVEKNKLDLLANAIAGKSGEPLTLTLDEMVEAVDGIEQNTGITPTGNIDITQAGVTDVTNYATATVPSADPYVMLIGTGFYTRNGNRRWRTIPRVELSVNEGDTEGWIADGYAKNGEGLDSPAVPTGTTVTPTTSSQTIGGANYMMEGAVTVNAVQSGALYPTINAGYISPQMILDDDIGEVTASYYNGVNTEDIVQTSGWVNEGASANILIGVQETLQLPTQAGATITPTESSQTAVAKGKFTIGAVTVSAIPSNYVGSGITQRSSSDLTASGATVTVPSGYYSAQASKAVSSGSATPASTISGTSATVSTGTNTLTLSKTVSNTPQVSAGYISSGTAGNSSVSLTANVTTKAAATITPTTSNQTISSGTYLTGTQTISGDANLVAGNIKSGTSIFGVTGTYTGGGGSSDIATGTLTVASNVNTSTSTTIATTTTIGFTPTKFFFWKEERTATNYHVHQASFITLGSNYIRTMTRYSSNALSTSGNTNNWTTQTAGYLYYNSNTVYFRSSSSYILSAGTWHWVAVK